MSFSKINSDPVNIYGKKEGIHQSWQSKLLTCMTTFHNLGMHYRFNFWNSLISGWHQTYHNYNEHKCREETVTHSVAVHKS